MFDIDAFTRGRIRNVWVCPHPAISAYVRKGDHLHPISKEHLRTFDIANVQVDEHERNKGLFSQWLHRVIIDSKRLGYQAVHIENVLTDRFADYFRRDDRWIETSHQIPSFFLVFGDDV
jgi:hypothetical protein